MQVTPETINGKRYNVVWHNNIRMKPKTYHLLELPFEAIETSCGVCVLHREGEYIATAIPPLPRNPKRRDKPMLYRYLAEGLRPQGAAFIGKMFAEDCDWLLEGSLKTITHCLDTQGNRVEVAIV